MGVDIRGRKMKKPPACVQCRKRKIGCDRAKPLCGNCVRNGKSDCFYPDIPGVYAQSGGGGATPPGKSAELASVEQIREYSARLQQLSMPPRPVPASPAPAEPTVYVPKVTMLPAVVRRYDYSAAGEEPLTHVVRGPAIFDTAKVPYTQDEIMAKELDFLRGRLLDLQKATGKTVPGLGGLRGRPGSGRRARSDTIGAEDDDSLLDGMDGHSLHSSGNGDGPASLKKRKQDQFDEFKSVDPSFLDPKQVLRVLLNKSAFFTPTVPIPGNENRLFHVGHLAMHDDYLCFFHNRLYDIMANTLPERLSQQQQTKLKPVAEMEPLRFPPKMLCTHWINYFTTQTDVSTLIPFVQSSDIIQSIDQWFPQKDVTFRIESISLDQLATLGLITLFLLFCYNSLSSTVLVPLKDDEMHRYEQLRSYVPQLHANLKSIMLLVCMGGSTNLSRKWKVRLLPFIAVMKFYQTLSGWSPSTSHSTDFDEDLNWSLDLGINHETQDQNAIIIWNFVYKNCCWRKLIHGELPLPLLSKLSGSSKILDSSLLQDYDFLKTIMKLLQYLHSREETQSVAKLQKLKLKCKEALNNASQRCYNAQLMVSHVVDTLVYRNMELFVDVYTLLHYESIGDVEKYNETFKSFIQFLQESVFYIFSGLANLKFAGYEYIFHLPTFTILKNILLILFSLTERTRLGVGKDTPELAQMNDTLITLIRKICMLISDYSKNCKKENPVVTDIKVIVATLLEANSYDHPAVPSSLRNGIKSLDILKINKNVAKLRTMSETLIKTDFYEKRGPFVPESLPTFGVTAGNFDSVYQAFFQ
ncbi:AAL057Cp [Eremothecium gossypii ATCC 10895]|uniref:AAL057Cp n=1 Tax=Eremothecium gossypii (strain ATCC 10895 / CBS 109.51 / FGSC 9923 / NRRL Y-1056) TaxID=284811 RepID=Q75EY5_EREGS|nr:AAL057Cp [Eremothecium gossypii ATCC 10895]AAS50309.1 AAL057Cp [Eremothecium gossypii ATCC 10895]AEY94595.1 FAAL057Cp [Eremothecium gossypii FDAG1]